MNRKECWAQSPGEGLKETGGELGEGCPGRQGARDSRKKWSPAARTDVVPCLGREWPRCPKMYLEFDFNVMSWKGNRHRCFLWKKSLWFIVLQWRGHAAPCRATRGSTRASQEQKEGGQGMAQSLYCDFYRRNGWVWVEKLRQAQDGIVWIVTGVPRTTGAISSCLLPGWGNLGQRVYWLSV